MTSWDVGVSDELAAGIAAYRARMTPLWGTIQTVRTPDGRTHTGVLRDTAAGCQPHVVDDQGRRWYGVLVTGTVAS